MTRIITHYLIIIFVFNPGTLHSAYESEKLHPPLSPMRYPGESYEEASSRALRTLGQAVALDSTLIEALGSAESSAVPYVEVDLSKLPDWRSYRIAQSEFERTRDLRFLLSPQSPSFPRRIPWLYPDDGCYLRAHSVVDIIKWNAFLPKKVFIFGTLVFKTTFSPVKNLAWWYHVAPAIRVGPEAYVFDPTVEPRSILRLSDWITRMGGNLLQVRVAICSSYSYDPASSCEGESPALTQAAVQRDRPTFLNAEWNQVVSLGYDATEILGDAPPW